MLPFFRKLRYRFASDNQFLKYSRYAVGETLLIVMGILIALQISNWKEERQLKEKERAYLKGMLRDLEVFNQELDRVIIDTKATSEATDTMFMLLTYNRQDILNDSMLISILSYVVDYSEISIQDATNQEIINTGSLDVISNEEIRRYIANSTERIHVIQKYEMEAKFNSRKLTEYMMDYFDFGRFEQRLSPLMPGKKENFFSDPMLRNRLGRVTSSQRTQHRVYKSEKKVQDSLRILLESELQ